MGKQYHEEMDTETLILLVKVVKAEIDRLLKIAQDATAVLAERMGRTA